MIGRSIGAFRIYRLIGQGSFGVVYAAWDMTLQRRIALKLIARPSDDDSTVREAIREEARAAANLEHENVVRIFETGEQGGWYFIAMELIEGCNLKQLMAQAGELDLMRVCQIMADVADAVAYAHRMGVLHRDLKPANLILTRSGRCKLTDFGFASQYYGQATEPQASTRVGTPAYMAPELRRGGSASTQSDIYSLGATVWHLLTGVPPQTPESNAVNGDDPAHTPDLKQFKPDAPARLIEIVNRSLRLRPEERGDSVDEIASVLRANTIPNGSLSPGSEEALRLCGALADMAERSPRRQWMRRVSYFAAVMVLAVLVGAGAVLGLYGLEAYQRRVASESIRGIAAQLPSYDEHEDLRGMQWLAAQPGHVVEATQQGKIKELTLADPPPLIQVTGQVLDARRSASGKVSEWILGSEGSPGGLHCVVFQESFDDMAAAFGGEFGEALVGKRVLVKGHLGRYRGEPQLVIATPAQIVVILQHDPAVSSPGEAYISPAVRLTSERQP